VIQVSDGVQAGEAINVEMDDGYHIKLTVALSHLRLESVGSDLYRCRAEGLGLLGAAGLPDVPAYHRYIAVPQGAEVAVSYKTEPAVLVPDVPLAANRNEFQGEYDAAPIAATGPTKMPMVEVGEVVHWRGLDLMPIWIRPVDFEAETTSLAVTPVVAVAITLAKGTFVGHPVPYGENSRNALRKLVANFDVLEEKGAIYPASKDEVAAAMTEGKDSQLDLSWCGDYLILAADDFVGTDAMNTLVAGLQARGFSVVVWREGDVPDDPLKERQDELRDAIRTCSPLPDYMFLVGDPDATETPGSDFRLITGLTGGVHTDNYFCRVVPEIYDGYLPDITCGRSSAKNLAEFGSIVTKTVSYASGMQPAERRATLVSFRSEQDVMAQENWRRLTNYGFLTDRLFETRGNCTKENVSAAVNAGRSVVDYTGHGSQCLWANSSYQCWDVYDLLNEAEYPFVFSGACQTGRFQDAECMADAWTEADGVGSVSYCGASTNSTIYVDYYAAAFRYDAVLDGGIREFGRIVDAMEEDTYLLLGGSPSARSFVEMYNAFGDPALRLNARAGDLRAMYKFEQIGDSTPDDESDWENDLQAGDGAPTYCYGPNGGCLEFMGPENWYVYSDALPDMSNQFSASIWLKPTAGENGYAVARGPATQDVAWYVRTDGVSQNPGLELALRTSDSVLHTFRVENRLRFDEWNHVVVTFEHLASPYQLKVYLDGELALEETLSLPLSGDQGTLWIGKGYGLQRYHGQLDEVRVYSRALSASDVGDISEASRRDLVAHYPMTVGTVVVNGQNRLAYMDRSGNRHHQIPPTAAPGGGVFTGIEREGAQFAGFQDLEAQDTSAMWVQDEVTVSAWVYFDGRPEGYLVRKPQWTMDEYSLFVTQDVVVAEVESCTAWKPLPQWSGWHHVAFTYSSERGAIIVYGDGQQIGTPEACSVIMEHLDFPLLLADGFVGGLDEARVYNRALSRREIGRLAFRGPVIGYWPMDGDGSDLGDYGNVGSLVAVQEVPDGKIGSALQFNGSTSCMTVASDGTVDIQGDELTIATWIRPEAVCAGPVLSKGGTSPAYGLYLADIAQYDDYLWCRIGWDNVGIPFGQYCGAQTWHHVACTYSRNSGFQKVYIDGLLAGTFWRKQEIPVNEEDLYLGCAGDGQPVFSGGIDDTYLYDVAFDETDVANLFAQGHGSTLARWEVDNAYQDSTPYGMDLSYGGDGEPPPFGPGRFGSAAQSNGDDELYRSPPLKLDTARRGFGLSYWLRAENDSFDGLPNPRVWRQPTSLDSAVRDSYFGYGEVPASISTTLYSEAGTASYFEFPFAAFERWAHVVFSYDQWSHKVLYYLNGRLEGALDWSEFFNGSASQPLYVGGYGSLPYGFLGAMDRVRVHGRAVTTTEARRLYSEGHVEGRWPFDHTASDIGPFAFRGTLVGDAGLQASNRWRGKALNLDGTGDYVEFSGIDEAMDRLKEQLTLSLWFRPSPGCVGIMAAKGSGLTTPFHVGFQDVPDTPEDYVFFRIRTTSGTLDGVIAADVVGSWHNVQLTFNKAAQDGRVKAYVDGGLEFSGDPSGDPDSDLVTSAEPLTFGRMSGVPTSMFAGQLDAIQMVNAALPPEGLATLRSAELLDLPFVSGFEDASPFRQRAVPLGNAHVDGSEQALLLNVEPGQDGGYVRLTANDAFDEMEDAFAIEFDARVLPGGLYRTILGSVDNAGSNLFRLMTSSGEPPQPDTLTLIIGDEQCTSDFSPYLETWTHISLRFDRFRQELALPTVRVELDNNVDSSSKDCTFTHMNTAYLLGNVYVGYYSGPAKLKMRNLVFRRTWE